MEEFNIQGKQTSFYKYCPGTFGYILVFVSHFFKYSYTECQIHPQRSDGAAEVINWQLHNQYYTKSSDHYQV
jgi:hypothetical protein